MGITVPNLEILGVYELGFRRGQQARGTSCRAKGKSFKLSVSEQCVFPRSCKRSHTLRDTRMGQYFDDSPAQNEV